MQHDRFGRFNWAVARPLLQGSLIGLILFAVATLVLLLVTE